MEKTSNDQSKLKDKGYEDGSPRYDRGLFPEYDAEYIKLAKSSFILNKSRRSNNMDKAGALHGISDCKRVLMTLVGGTKEPDHYRKGTTWYKAGIPAAKDILKTVYADYKLWQKQQVRAGKALKPPQKWPANHLTQRLKAEALLDVRRKEKTFVEQRIQKLKAQQGKLPKDTPMLPDGPVGKFSGDRLRSVDGQRISFSPSGIPYVDHSESPYDGMSVLDYRKMSKRWKKDNRITRNDLNLRTKAYREKAREQVDNFPPMFGWGKFKDMIQGRVTYKNQSELPDFTPWPENPDWPSDAKPITDIEQELQTAEAADT